MTVAYDFSPFLAALGDDFFSDEPDLAAVLAHHGLADGPGLDRVTRYGVFAARSMSAGAATSDRPGHLPTVIGYGPHGRPHPMGVEVHPATKRLLAASLRAGAASEPDVRVRYAMAYLGAQVGEAGVSCPLACTDGFLRAVDELGGPQPVLDAAAHVRMQAPGGPVHAAQFVTEAQGGSDAGTNVVRAVPQSDGSVRLHGNKFFCSNLWAQYWVVTARPDGAREGARGVALYMVPRVIDGEANGFRVERLKDKLGTRSLPTAELTLSGAVGWPIGSAGSGLSNMVRIVLTTSRFWTGLAGVGLIRAAERIAHAYAQFRHAFGGPIARFPLVEDALETLTRDRRHMLACAFDVLACWERVVVAERAGEQPPRDAMIRARVLVMLFKTWATRRATRRVHDAIMILGGNGIEEQFSPLPRLLRDAVIMETWEGPHGLLLSRSLAELQHAGGADEAEALASILLPATATTDERLATGTALAAVLRTTDARAQMVTFQSFVDDLLDRSGAIAWRAIEAGAGASPLG